ncbi:MAG TPA: DUF6265 family protein [Brevundimonas sp.]|jgi:hypothetical protein
MILAALTTAALLQTATVTADQLSWISGYWLSCDDEREASETWTGPRGGLMLGSSVTMRDGRLSSFESSRIATVDEAGGDVSYFAGVEGAAPVAFTATEATGTRVVFENVAHDFPNRIVYELVKADDGIEVLNARIEGHIDGRLETMHWSYRKAELNRRCPN